MRTDQDKQVERIGVLVDDVHHIGVGIGDKLDAHSRLIDDTTEEIDKADESLQAQTKRIIQVMRESGALPISRGAVSRGVTHGPRALYVHG